MISDYDNIGSLNSWQYQEWAFDTSIILRAKSNTSILSVWPGLQDQPENLSDGDRISLPPGGMIHIISSMAKKFSRRRKAWGMRAFFLPSQLNHSHNFFASLKTLKGLKFGKGYNLRHSIVRFQKHIQYLVSGKFLVHVYVLIDGFT